MRKFHRWISTAAMVLLAWVAVTGVLLACLEITVHYLPPLNNNATAAATFNVDRSAAVLPAAEVEALITRSIRTALSTAPTSPYTDVDLQLRMTNGAANSTVILNGAINQQVEINATTGAALSQPVIRTQTQRVAAATGLQEWQVKFLKMRTKLHVILEGLHRGNIIGISGQVMDILTGLAFVILSITGVFMYVEMLGRRRKLGRSGLFWK